MSNKDDTEDLKKKLTAKRKPPVKVPWNKGLSSGSTLLNLAATGRPLVTYLPGHLYWIIGDSNAGKSWLSLNCFAEAALNKHYEAHRFIYDSVENGALMDLNEYFGKAVEDRMEAPLYDDEMPDYSTTVEEFYYNLDAAFDEGEPFIYVLDSMDALDSEDDEDKFEERKEAHEKGKKGVSGSYGTSKAKLNSSYLRRARNRLKNTESIIIIISQTRDNIGFGAQFNPKTVSGGKALKFYCDLQMWLAIKEEIKGTRKGKPRSLGIKTSVKIDKNRFTGQKHKIEFPIRWKYGLDDIGSMLDWMVEEGIWSKTKGGVDAKDLKLKGTVDGLIAQIEEKGMERELRLLVTDSWEDIIEACNTGRKKRYT